MAGQPATADFPTARRPLHYVLKVLRSQGGDPMLVTVVAGPFFDYVSAWHTAGIFRAYDSSAIFIASEMCLEAGSENLTSPPP